METIKVYRWEEAPKEMQEEYNFSGDEDWLIEIPTAVAERFTVLFEDKQRNSAISTWTKDDGSKIILIGNA